MRIAGRGRKLSYNRKTRNFQFEFEHFKDIDAPTEIFVPMSIYNKGIDVKVSDGTFDFDEEHHLIIYNHTKESAVHTVNITSK